MGGAKVILRAPAGTEERTGVTGKDGRVAVFAPSADFAPVRVELDGLVPADELRSIWSALKGLAPDRFSQGKDEVRWELPVVRRAWLLANMKVRTREQADAVAADWGRDCGPGGPSAVEFREGAWHYTFSCLVMCVDSWTGKGGVRAAAARGHDHLVGPVWNPFVRLPERTRSRGGEQRWS